MGAEDEWIGTTYRGESWLSTISYFYTRETIPNPRYDIGKYTYGTPAVYDWEQGATLSIGSYTSISDGVSILLGGNHRTEWVTTYPFGSLRVAWPTAAGIEWDGTTKGDVVIGNDVWIGHGVTILSGITIGHGAVLAAQAVVVKNVAPYGIVVGNPATLIKHRFPPADVEALLEARWWDWADEFVREHVAVLCSGDVARICALSRELRGQTNDRPES